MNFDIRCLRPPSTFFVFRSSIAKLLQVVSAKKAQTNHICRTIPCFCKAADEKRWPKYTSTTVWVPSFLLVKSLNSNKTIYWLNFSIDFLLAQPDKWKQLKTFSTNYHQFSSEMPQSFLKETLKMPRKNSPVT